MRSGLDEGPSQAEERKCENMAFLFVTAIIWKHITELQNESALYHWLKVCIYIANIYGISIKSAKENGNESMFPSTTGRLGVEHI